MRGQFRRWAWLLIPAVLGMMLVGCDTHKGSLFANQQPSVSITTQNGYDLGGDSNPESCVDSTNVTLFQQSIHWSAQDPDGWVVGYCYRVLDVNGNPIPTPGNDKIDTGNGGWVLHDKTGVTSGIPYAGGANVDPGMTIWTDVPYTLINFPASDAEHANNVPSVLEVKCIDNRGEISAPSRKLFVSKNISPKVTIRTTKGEIDGKTVGLGVRFKLGIADIASTASYEYKLVSGNRFWYYEYQLQKINATTGVMISTTDTLNTRNFKNPSIFPVLKDPYPKDEPEQEATLSSDFNNGTQVTKTRMIARVRDISGMYSEPDTVVFSVRDDFKPKALIYDKKAYCIGTSHFTDVCKITPEDIFTEETAEGVHCSTPFFINSDTQYSALWSNDFRAWLRWGYHGEYDGDSQSPSTRQDNIVKDANTHVNYLSEIIYYDIRLDGQPYFFAPYASDPDYEAKYLHTDDNGLTWLRVPSDVDIAQLLVISNLAATDPLNMDVNDPNAFHTFEVCAVDLQMKASDPAVFRFKLDETIPQSEKSGVLVIDDDSDPTWSPDGPVDTFYDYILDGFTHTTLHRNDIVVSYYDSQLHQGMDALSPTDLQKYQYVLWHSDNPPANVASNLWKESEVLSLYMRTGGNLIISSGATLSTAYSNANDIHLGFLGEYLGMLGHQDPLFFMSGNLLVSPWCTGFASQVTGLSDIDLNYDGLTESLGSQLTNRQGIGSIAFFNLPFTTSTDYSVLYKGKIKAPGTDSFSPSQENYDKFNDQVCGYRYQHTVANSTDTQSTVVLGFPLSYMDKDQAKTAIATILNGGAR
jgi:hypothetical protein